MIRTLLLLLCMTACTTDDGPERRREAPDPVTVIEVAKAAPGTVSRVLVSNAVIQSDRSADIIPQTSGIVMSVYKDDGDPVHKGEVLAILENASLDAGVERAQADLQRLTDEVQQLEALQARGAISQRELDDARYRLSTAQTTALEASSAKGFTRLTAPFAGVVARRDVRVGELAPAGKIAFSVVDPAQLRVVASLPERDLRSVQVGQAARLVSAYDDALSASGRVSRVAPVVDANTGTFRVTIDVDASQEALRPGQFVSVELVVETHSDVLVVPREAVVWEDGSAILYRMIPAPPPDEDEEKGDKPQEEAESFFTRLFGGEARADEPDAGSDTGPELPKLVAERVPAELGLVDSQNAEIVSGVAEGDDIITIGQSGLRDGAAVRTPELQAQAREAEKARREAEKAEKKASGAEGKE